MNALKYKTKAPAKFWATVAIAFLGCRLEELAQINLASDLIYDAVEGIWYIKIDEREDEDGIVKKSVKVQSSWRLLPLHSALIDSGFTDYLLEQRKLGYRPSRFANSAGYPKITLDGENKGGLKNGGYLVFRVSPGSHTITQEYSWTWDFKANPVVVNAKKNSQYFVRLDTGVHIGDPSAVVNGVSRYISFEEVEESVGLVEIKDLHISN